MLRYPVLCCSGVQNRRLGVSDFSATCAKPGRANSRAQNASMTFEISMGYYQRAKEATQYRLSHRWAHPPRRPDGRFMVISYLLHGDREHSGLILGRAARQ